MASQEEAVQVDRSPCWSEKLATARTYKGESNFQCLESSFKEHVEAFRQQIQQYRDVLYLPQKKDALDKHSKKELILNTRAAFRFCSTCYQCCEEDDDDDAGDRSSRETLQECSFAASTNLIDILLHNRGDASCRVMAARLLNNLITRNSQTAAVLVNQLKLCPSDEEISELVRQEQLVDDNADTNGGDSMRARTWTDLILSSASNRDALGALVATIHNCMSSLENHHVELRRHWEEKVAQSSLLVATLLRQTVSVKRWQSVNDEEEANESCSSETQKDAATEWLCILFGRLYRRGHLRQVYRAAGGGNSVSLQNTLPEQLVLLRCIQDSVVKETASLDVELKAAGFFTKLYQSIRKRQGTLQQLAAESKKEDNSGDQTDLDIPMLNLLLEVIGERLGDESPNTPILREALVVEGTLASIDDDENIDDNEEEEDGTSAFLSQVCVDLGCLVDILTLRNNGRKARDVSIENNEQIMLIGLVRLLGNACYRCKMVQDALRTISVPVLIRPETPHTSPTCTQPTSNGEPASSLCPSRSALHVLLSCTGLAAQCSIGNSCNDLFLREWAIVAIRHVLQDNEENMKVVAELEAQQPIQTGALDELGVQARLDGTVSVTDTKATSEAYVETFQRDKSNG